jgi:acyl-coenzyme A synthetase/AMP-(fatty) acid ligase
MAGYWGRSDLTEAATFRRATAGGNEDLFHRTGDLVELRSDGMFKFLGRKDRQIKTRGHRVELDEVEAALLTHSAVEEAAAFGVPDGHGSQRIEAAVILADRSSERPQDLEKHLRSQLPPYAIPTRVEVLSTFPRTTTGKIDRRMLREQAISRASSSDLAQTPRQEMPRREEESLSPTPTHGDEGRRRVTQVDEA